MTLELTDDDKQLLLWWRPRGALVDDIDDSYAHRGLDLFGRYLAADGKAGHAHLLRFCRQWRGELGRAQADADRDERITAYLAGGEFAAAWPDNSHIVVMDEAGAARTTPFTAGTVDGALNGAGHIADETGRALCNLALFALDDESGYYHAFAEAVAHWRVGLLNDVRWRAHAKESGEQPPETAKSTVDWLGSPDNGVPLVAVTSAGADLLSAIRHYNAYAEDVYKYCSYYQTPVLDHLDPAAFERALSLVERHGDKAADQDCRVVRRWLAEMVRPYQDRFHPGGCPVELTVAFDALGAATRANLPDITYGDLPEVLGSLGLSGIHECVKAGVRDLRTRSSVPDVLIGHVSVGVGYAREEKRISVTVRLLDSIRADIAARNGAVLEDFARGITTCYYVQAADLVALSCYPSQVLSDPLGSVLLRIASRWYENTDAAFTPPAAGVEVGKIDRLRRWGPKRDAFQITRPKVGGGDCAPVQRLIEARFPRHSIRTAANDIAS